MFPELMDTLNALMGRPEVPEVDAAMKVLEIFVVLLYDKTSSKSCVNEARVDLFARNGRDIYHIPPTQGSLLQHVKRAVYQAGYCWSQSLNPIMELPLSDEWGWKSSCSGTWEFCGVNFLRQVRFAENLYAVAVPRAAIQIASARNLPCPVQLCANMLVLVR